VNRQQRRAMKKMVGQKSTTAVDMMLNMPKECNTCKASFDRTNREMAMTWTVKVYEAAKKVDLFCPECMKAETDGIRKE
jgi:hypothetical protein